MGHWEFAGTDAARALCKEQARLLIDKAAELEFDQIQYLVGWISREDRVTESETWQQIAKALENRWTAEQDRNRKEQIAGVLTQVLSERCGASAYLAFLRRQVGEGPERDRADYRSQLFKALLSQPWSLECEQEAFGLLPELPFDKDWYAPLTQVEALYRLNDWAVRGRHSALMSLVRKKEGLSRTELKAEKAETLRKAREGLAKSLAEQAARQDARLRPWIDVERLSLAVLLKDDPTRIAAECWKSVGAEPPKPEKPLKWLDAVLLARHLRILEYFASRPNADLALIDRLLAWIDKAIALNPDDLAWESHKYRLLVALDRPDDTEKAVRAWIRPGEADTTWRVTLGYLLAERNRVPEAIEQFEAVKPPYELGPQEYRSLADWYMLTNDKEKREEGELLQVVTEQGDKLENRLRQELETWQGRERPPDEVDPKLIRALTALFRGSSPEKHVPLLNQFYSVTRDFRLLECLPEGIIGHTAGQVYPFLQQLRPVLDEIQDEATADSLVRSLAKTRSRAKTPVDQRALDLLLVQVKRRAAEVTNQPGQHVPDALKAMKRSFKGEWSPGERRLMADLLADLGQISQSPLAEEQLRQLAALQRDEPKGTPDRLHVTYCYAKTLGHYSQWDQALGLLQAGLEDLRLASGGTLPKSAQEILGAFVSFLETQKQHGRAEKFLLAEMERPANEAMLKYYRQRLYELYGNALSQSCEVSLGSGATLYEALEQKLLEECRTRDTNYRYALLRQLCGLYRTASEGKIGGAQDDLRQFAWKRLPELVAYHTDDTQSIVETAAGVLHDALGPREGLAFLIARCEKEPTWLRRSENSTWNSHAATMGQWRREAGEIGDLAPRLLELAADALRLDLETHQTRYGSIYCQGTNFFWGEKAEDFAWVAEEVYAKRKNSGSHIARIARYLHDDLRRVERAIEMLFDAYRQELLDDWGKSLLAWYLGEKGRHQEAIPILQKLLDQQPKNLDCRIQLMHAHFRAGRKAETQRLLDATDTYLRTQGDWWQNDVTKFADACLATEQYEKSIVLYKKLVAWRPSVRGRTPADNYSLPSYYTNMARAYAGLGQTADAVEAVARAIVSWGNMHEERQDALETLKKTLRDAKHLDDYVKQLDKQVAETGLENPIVRKAVGQTYLEKGQFEQAIRNLQLAVQVQPNDTETHNALIQAYELQRDPKGAIRQLVALARLSRRNIQCYNDLGYRLTAAGKPAEAERAYTTIVEMQPNESESHSFLALIRQQQDRWDDAIAHWRQVARIRALEPTGLLRLAEAQIHQKRWGEARESLGTLLNRSWPSQFGDVHAEAKRLLQQVEDGQR
jgi:tetratricopeptide (TPR) repeat protein